MRKITFSAIIFSIFFAGCELNQSEDNFRYEEKVQTKYDLRLQKDPNYKLNVNDLNIQQDIDDNSLFCYSTAKTTKEKMQKLIEGLRGIPIDCNGGIDTSGGFSCLLESELLDTAAKENSLALASGGASKSLSDRANENGYDAKFLVGGTIIQNDLSEKAMIEAVEKKMKTDANFCSYVVSKKTKDLGVGYADSDDSRRYWTIILGDNGE